MTPRAVRNNNPGNLRIGQPWKGLMPHEHMDVEQALEDEFCVFENPMWGFRALASVFLHYARHDHITTLRGAIARFAPSSENNTGAYLNAVVNMTRFGPDAAYPFTTPAAMQELCHAVAFHESGGWFFKSADLVAGVNAAH